MPEVTPEALAVVIAQRRQLCLAMKAIIKVNETTGPARASTLVLARRALADAGEAPGA